MDRAAGRGAVYIQGKGHVLHFHLEQHLRAPPPTALATCRAPTHRLRRGRAARRGRSRRIHQALVPAPRRIVCPGCELCPTHRRASLALEDRDEGIMTSNSPNTQTLCLKGVSTALDGPLWGPASGCPTNQPKLPRAQRNTTAQFRIIVNKYSIFLKAKICIIMVTISNCHFFLRFS